MNTGTRGMSSRLVLLFSIAWVMGLTEPWFSVLGNAISGRDVILIGGGLFLLVNIILRNTLQAEGYMLLWMRYGIASLSIRARTYGIGGEP